MKAMKARYAWIMMCGLSAAVTQANEGPQESGWDFSGFTTLTASKVMSGSRKENMNDYHCPCFIADYGQGAVVGPHWNLGQESKLGLQGSYHWNRQWSATSQVVVRGVDGVKADMEWAYLTFNPTAQWTLQAGRKRLPLYYYSDLQDVGFAYNWSRLPTEIYGWEMVNYNGANATYRDQWKGWAVKWNVLGGRESTKDNRYGTLYNSDRQDITWKNIMGTDIEFNKDQWTLRANYIQSDVQQWNVDASGTVTRVTPQETESQKVEKQKMYGLALNWEGDSWLWRSEYSVFDRSSYSYRSRAWMTALGYKYGNWTPMITATRYAEHNSHAPQATQSQKVQSISLRYDVDPKSDIKVQWDHYQDHSGADMAAAFVGSSRVLAVTYDRVF